MWLSLLGYLFLFKCITLDTYSKMVSIISTLVLLELQKNIETRLSRAGIFVDIRLTNLTHLYKNYML